MMNEWPDGNVRKNIQKLRDAASTRNLFPLSWKEKYANNGVHLPIFLIGTRLCFVNFYTIEI